MKCAHSLDALQIRTCSGFELVTACQREAYTKELGMTKCVQNGRMIEPIASFCEHLARNSLANGVVNALPVEFNCLRKAGVTHKVEVERTVSDDSLTILVQLLTENLVRRVLIYETLLKPYGFTSQDSRCDAAIIIAISTDLGTAVVKIASPKGILSRFT
jgi:hypothetical protein